MRAPWIACHDRAAAAHPGRDSKLLQRSTPDRRGQFDQLRWRAKMHGLTITTADTRRRTRAGRTKPISLGQRCVEITRAAGWLFETQAQLLIPFTAVEPPDLPLIEQIVEQLHFIKIGWVATQAHLGGRYGRKGLRKAVALGGQHTIEIEAQLGAVIAHHQMIPAIGQEQPIGRFEAPRQPGNLDANPARGPVVGQGGQVAGRRGISGQIGQEGGPIAGTGSWVEPGGKGVTGAQIGHREIQRLGG